MKVEKIVPEKAEEGRKSRRTHAFLAATLETDGKVWPVRLRNISETGALIDAPAKLSIGTTLTLCRSDVEIPCTVVREDKGFVGLFFDQPLSAATVDMLKVGKSSSHGGIRAVAPKSPEDAGKSASGSTGNSAFGSGLRPSRSPLDARLARELQYARSLLQFITEPIINDHTLLQRYGRNLQEIDYISQLLGHVAQIIATEDKEIAINQIGVAELRSRLKGEQEQGKTAKK